MKIHKEFKEEWDALEEKLDNAEVPVTDIATSVKSMIDSLEDKLEVAENILQNEPKGG